MFAMNIKNYPDHPMAYEWPGDLYAAKGDKANAVANYKKLFSLKKSEVLRKKLQQLKGKK